MMAELRLSPLVLPDVVRELVEHVDTKIADAFHIRFWAYERADGAGQARIRWEWERETLPLRLLRASLIEPYLPMPVLVASSTEVAAIGNRRERP